MTNKDYKPLTTGGYANSKMLQEYRDRLCYLEDCIENGTLGFLPCKVGDTIYEVFKNHRPPFIQQTTIEKIIITRKGLRLKLERNSTYETSITAWGKTLFPTKEAAEKALEELQNGKDKG